MKIGFDNDKYLKMQSSHIRDRIAQFDNKLYLEFGGKLFDDYHASRVLPGFQPDSKLRLLKQLADQAEIVIVISAGDIESNKVRGDLGITYDSDVLRLRKEFMPAFMWAALSSHSTVDKAALIFSKPAWNALASGSIFIMLYLVIREMSRSLSVMKDTARMITLRQNVLSL